MLRPPLRLCSPSALPVRNAFSPYPLSAPACLPRACGRTGEDHAHHPLSAPACLPRACGRTGEDHAHHPLSAPACLPRACGRTGEDHAHQLGALLSGLKVLLNLIPWNPVLAAKEAHDYSAPSPEAVHRFQAIVRARYQVPTTVRQEKGQDIAGACGQLALEKAAARQQAAAAAGGNGGGGAASGGNAMSAEGSQGGGGLDAAAAAKGKGQEEERHGPGAQAEAEVGEGSGGRRGGSGGLLGGLVGGLGGFLGNMLRRGRRAGDAPSSSRVGACASHAASGSTAAGSGGLTGDQIPDSTVGVRGMDGGGRAVQQACCVDAGESSACCVDGGLSSSGSWSCRVGKEGAQGDGAGAEVHKAKAGEGEYTQKEMQRHSSNGGNHSRAGLGKVGGDGHDSTAPQGPAGLRDIEELSLS